MIGFPKPPRTGPKPKRPLPRSKAPIPRNGRVRSVNPARQKREKMRKYGSLAHRAWLHAQPCAITGQYGTEYNPIVAMHVKGDGGTGYKASARYQIPALYSIHNQSHGGVQTFEAKYNVNLQELAAQHYARFLNDMREAEYALGEITTDDIGEDAEC